MYGLRITIALAAGAVLTTGCISSPWSSDSAATGPPSATPAAQQMSSAVPAAAVSPTAASGTMPADDANRQAMLRVIAEVRELHVLDPGAEEELLESLHQTPPELWPLVAQQFRAAVEYRLEFQRRAQQEKVAKSPQAGADGVLLNAGPSPLAMAPGPDASASPGRGSSREAWAADAQEFENAGGLPVSGDVAEPRSIGPAADVPGKGQPLPSGANTAAASDGDEGYALDNRVRQVSYEAESPEDWQGHLNRAVGLLETEVEGSPQSSDEVTQHARLRLLQVLAGRRDEALAPIPMMAPSRQDFWSKELCGLAALLDGDSASDATQRVAEAQPFLSEAAERLGESSPLVVRNMAFVTDVQSYGDYTPFDENEFVPGQKVLLYAEVENFRSKQTAKGFHTALRSSYKIFDSRKQQVADHEFNTNEECCRNRRRDFFIGYEFSLPVRLYAGEYNLQLTVEDLNGGKIGQSTIEFTVREP